MDHRNKILVVDDEKTFTGLLKLNLEATGRFEVCIENDPRKVVMTALNFKPNLILLDVIMPELEGPDVMVQLRENFVLHDVPIIFLTATITREEVISQGGRIGGNQFVAKPSTFKDLLTSIENNLMVC